MLIKSVCTALALMSLCGGYANAGTIKYSNSDDVVSARISYEDLDLSNAAGGRAMLARIRAAAKGVCGDPYDALWQKYEYQPCVDKAIDRAVARLGSPVVTALNSGHGSKEPVALASR